MVKYIQVLRSYLKKKSPGPSCLKAVSICAKNEVFRRVQVNMHAQLSLGVYENLEQRLT